MSSKIWLTADSYPIFVVIGLGVGAASYFGVRTLSNHNDIVINKKQQQQFAVHPNHKLISPETQSAIKKSTLPWSD